MTIMTVLVFKVFRHTGWSSFILPTKQYSKGIFEGYAKTQFSVILKKYNKLRLVCWGLL